LNEAVARDQLIEQILDHLMLMGADVDRLAGAAARFNRLNRTDLRALQVLRGGGLTAGDLARALHVTSGATTRVIDGLAADGHVVREADPRDRRRVLVKLTPAAAEIVTSTFEGLLTATRGVLDAYSDDHLEMVASFLADVRTLIREHTRLLSSPRPRP
jgi:DNA-binding MarR family transcriptional regulator